MNEALAMQGQGQSRLFQNSNMDFLERATELLVDMGSLLDKTDSVLNNEGVFKNSAVEYRRMSLIKRNFEANPANINYLIAMLSEHLKFIERHDKGLAQLIMTYGPTSSKQLELLGTISNLLEDPARLSANLDILLEQVETIEDKELKAKIRARLLLMKRYLDEIRVLNYDLADIGNWNMHVHDDITFFTETINAYFEGSKPENRRRFTALNGFKDEVLRKQVFSNREVRTLYFVAQFTHRAQAQVEFIEQLIAFLHRDIGRDGTWERDVATKQFVDHLEEYAERFKTEFRNKLFAGHLLAKKKTIGEQPFAWVQLLKRMKEQLTGLMPRKNAVIDDARNQLSIIFRTRIEALKSSIIGLLSQLRQLMGPQGEGADFLAQVEKGIKRMEASISKIWKNRKKRFKKLKGRIRSLSTRIIPELRRLIQRYIITSEAEAVARNYRAMRQFGQHVSKVATVVGQVPSSKNIPHLLMLAFDFARIEEMPESINKAVDSARQKDANSRNLKIDELKINVDELVRAYIDFIRLISTLGLGVDTKTITEKIIIFRRDYYG